MKKLGALLTCGYPNRCKNKTADKRLDRCKKCIRREFKELMKK